MIISVTKWPATRLSPSNQPPNDQQESMAIDQNEGGEQEQQPSPF
jgi:hypothetical protein